MAKPSFELHLSPDAELPKRFGKKIRALGGDYNECRGYNGTRFVKIPATKPGRELADALLTAFPGGVRRGGMRTTGYAPGLSTVILRKFPRVPDLVTYVTATRDAELQLRQQARKLFAAGELPRPKTAAERAAERLARAVAQVERLRDALASAEAELAELQQG